MEIFKGKGKPKHYSQFELKEAKRIIVQFTGKLNYLQIAKIINGTKATK